LTEIKILIRYSPSVKRLQVAPTGRVESKFVRVQKAED